jgi:hypothetical protein
LPKQFEAEPLIVAPARVNASEAALDKWIRTDEIVSGLRR